MSWLDEGALFSQVGAFLNEDIGRGDITTQSTVMRSQSAKGRFIAKEAMVVCGLEAAEAVGHAHQDRGRAHAVARHTELGLELDAVAHLHANVPRA